MDDTSRSAVRILVLPITYQCTGRCVMCNVWRNDHRVLWTATDLVGLLIDSTMSSVEVVNVTGGEPAISPECGPVIDALLDHLPRLRVLSIQTNGLEPDAVAAMLGHATQSLRDRGRAVHLDVNISLDGPEEVHDAVRGVPGAWRRTMATTHMAKQILSTWPTSALLYNCTVVHQNARHLRDVHRSARQVDVEITYTVPQVTDVYMANTDSAGQFALTGEDIEYVIGFLTDLRSRAKGSHTMSPRYCEMLVGLLHGRGRSIRCPLAAVGLFIEPEGAAYPCWRSSDLLLGNVRNESLVDVLGRRDSPVLVERLEGLCMTCTSNCYTEWARRSFTWDACG